MRFQPLFTSFRFLMTGIFVMGLSSLAPLTSLRIDCDYKVEHSVITECVTKNLEVRTWNESVTIISGNLLGELIYDEIKTFTVNESPLLEFLPTGIEKFFPNLEKIEISDSGLKNLTQNSLKNLTKLRFLILNNNKLEDIDSNPFEFNNKIEKVDLSGNQIKIFQVGSLKVLKHLKKLDLSNNLCINETADNPFELKKLKINIYENCAPSRETNFFDFLFNVGFFCLLAVLFAFLLIFVINCAVKN